MQKPNNKKILYLTIKKKWFDMIRSGEKKEEYREIKKYWIDRFHNKRFDLIVFRNGYGKDSPEIMVEMPYQIITGKGHEEWGAPKEDVFIIFAGKIIYDSQAGE